MGGVAAASTLAVIAIVLYLIQGISNGANELDDNKTKIALNSLFAGLRDTTSGMVADNARWDDAVDHSYSDTEEDAQWLYDTWGSASNQGNYDAFFLIGETGRTVAGYEDGKPISASADTFIGPSFKHLLSTLPQDKTTFRTIADIEQTTRGPAVVAIAPILPAAEGKSIPTARPRVLVFVTTLTPEVVAAVGNRSAINNLRIVPEPETENASVPIFQADGKTSGYAVWTPDRPGDTARAAVQGPAAIALCSILACMIFFIFKTSRMSLQLQRSEKQAWTVAHSDTLTDLPNRLAVKQMLDQKVAERTAQPSTGLTVMLADLDGFKDVNDTYGHHVGDDLIKGIAAGLQVIAEKFDATVSRLGGDEFAVILSGEDSLLRAKALSKGALDFLVEPLNLSGRIAKVGITIGIANAAEDALDGSELMRRADVAMYFAKSNGKNQFFVYEPRLDAERNSRVDMAKLLAETLRDEKLEVAYQPIVDSKSRAITSVEALARWKQPGGMYVPPDQFIRVAEEFGLIDRLGNTILKIACRDAAKWPELVLSVNISPAQFRNPDFVINTVAIIDGSGLPRNRIELEVTESYLIEQQERARPMIENLRSLGIKVALDDFGTGYTSIGYLQKYKFDRLKIDRSLVRSMISNAATRSIIQATAVVAQSMDMAVTAEGVETEEEANMLWLAGCNSLQGFHFGRPQAAESITSLLGDALNKKIIA